MNLNKKQISQKAPKLSRIDYWRRNPIPWIVGLAFILSIGGYYIFPKADEWLKKTAEIRRIEAEQPELEQQKNDLNIRYEELKNKYEELASEVLKREKQIFPEEINISKIVKILELYALVLDNDIDTYFKLESVNFVPPSPTEEKLKYRVTKTNIKIVGTRTDIYNFITFLESGMIPKNVRQKVRGATDIAIDLRFLAQNLLPLATLDSIRINEYKSTETDIENLFSVEIQVNFYSQ